MCVDSSGGSLAVQTCMCSCMRLSGQDCPQQVQGFPLQGHSLGCKSSSRRVCMYPQQVQGIFYSSSPLLFLLNIFWRLACEPRIWFDQGAFGLGFSSLGRYSSSGLCYMWGWSQRARLDMSWQRASCTRKLSLRIRLPQWLQRISEGPLLLLSMYLPAQKVNISVALRTQYIVQKILDAQLTRQQNRSMARAAPETIHQKKDLSTLLQLRLRLPYLLSSARLELFPSLPHNLNIIFILILMSAPQRQRMLKLVLGEDRVQAIAKSRVLIVGAGGIGCELLKNLAKSGYKHITILDFDSIEITNLNRQFYFRKDHVGKSKAETVKEMMGKLDQSIRVEAINASIYDNKFNHFFYGGFDAIFSCLDSMKAREHLARQATRCGVPLIDAGTQSYYGQAYASIRFLTSCHNCNPTHSEQTPAFCTIRSRPQLPMHCATYAKNFYDSFFGVNQAEALSDNLKYSRYAGKEELSESEIERIGSCLFEEMFNASVQDIDLEGNKIDFVRKLTAQEATRLTETVENPLKSTFNEQEHRRQQSSPYREEQLWSISEYHSRFMSSVGKLLLRKAKQESPACFEKDDEDCMTLVVCITNLRTFNFMSCDSPHNKHKFLTYYQCKDLIGRVFPAIASTNAIAAALQARETAYILAGDTTKLRYISFGNRSDERISPSFQGASNTECQVCSEKAVYSSVSCDMNTTTFAQLMELTSQQLFTKHREVTCGKFSIVRCSKGQYNQNFAKTLSCFQEMIHAGVMELSFMPRPEHPQFAVNVSVVHEEGAAGVQLRGMGRREAWEQVRRYLRRARDERVGNEVYELQACGGFEL